jgi:PD-(D/E)XK nuclease superfamily
MRTDWSEPPLLRTSERGDFRCPWKWEQRWLHGLVPVREPTWALFGRAWHVAMQIYYPPGRKRGKVSDAIDAFLEALSDEGRKIGVDIEDIEEDERMKAEAKGKDVKLVPARELGPLMLQEYHAYYEGDLDWEVIHTEQTFQIDVPRPNAPRSSVLVVYAGTWDAFMRHIPTRRYWLWDHKTAKTIPSPGYLDLDDQAGTYPWVAKEVLVHKGIITRRDRVTGIIFNYAKKSPPDVRPKNSRGESLNKDGSVSKKQPAKRFERYESPRSPKQIVQQARRVQEEAIVMEKMRNGELPIYKKTNYDCERCVLFDMCSLHEQGDDWEFYRDEMFKHRDPYADHREDMERNGIEL